MKEFFIQGTGRKVCIDDGDFKAQKSGGQATVYLQGSTAYKIYSDPAGMVPPAKIRQLGMLADPRIVRPKEILLNQSSEPVGYSMDAVTESYVLCQLFPRAFRDRQGITPARVNDLVKQLAELTRHFHDRGFLVVDLNEMNYLLSKSLDTIYQIDVDSIQTPVFPASALMESVRDRHAQPNEFNTGTDWFAFAVVSFQMFVGIHPYKGIHPAIKSLDDRMTQNVSVLNPEVGVPAAVLPFAVIPDTYRQWYQAVLEEGCRIPPPEDWTLRSIRIPATQPVIAGQAFRIDTLFEVPAAIAGYYECSTAHSEYRDGVVVTADGIYAGAKRVAGALPNTVIASTPRQGKPIAAWIDDGSVRFRDLIAGFELDQSFHAEQIMSTDGRIYLKQANAVMEVTFVEAGTSIVASIRLAAHVMPKSTQLFEGVAIQYTFGTCLASFFSRPGIHHILRIPEFEGGNVVDARYQNKVLIAMMERSGIYSKLIMRFDEEFRNYDVRCVDDVAVQSINFTVLDSGVAIHINERDEVEIFRNMINNPGTKALSDPALQGDCRLYKRGAQAIIARGSQMSAVAMKS